MYLLMGFGIFIALGVGADAKAVEAPVDLNVTKLVCSIRDGKFFSQLDFKVDLSTGEPKLIGELANYSVSPNGSRKYISGLIFTHLAYNNNRVTGDTGDPYDTIGRFILTRLDGAIRDKYRLGYSGRWAYWFQRSQSEIVRAIFNCTYQEPKYPIKRR